MNSNFLLARVHTDGNSDFMSAPSGNLDSGSSNSSRNSSQIPAVTPSPVGAGYQGTLRSRSAANISVRQSVASDDTGTDDPEFVIEIIGAKPIPGSPEVKLVLK